jgi:hypothetical protein
MNIALGYALLPACSSGEGRVDRKHKLTVFLRARAK